MQTSPYMARWESWDHDERTVAVLFQRFDWQDGRGGLTVGDGEAQAYADAEIERRQAILDEARALDTGDPEDTIRLKEMVTDREKALANRARRLAVAEAKVKQYRSERNVLLAELGLLGQTNADLGRIIGQEAMNVTFATDPFSDKRRHGRVGKTRRVTS